MLLPLVEIIDQLGFAFYTTVWMAALGLIAFGGFYTRVTTHRRGQRRRFFWLSEILISWFVGLIMFFNTTANFALFMAVALRIFLEFLFVFYVWFFGLQRHPHYVKIRSILFMILLVLLFSSLWNPQIKLQMLGVDKLELLEPQPLDPLASIQQITHEDLKDIRIVSQEYAAQLPRTELVETGYTVGGRNGAVDVYPSDGKLQWVTVYEPTVFLKKGKPSPYYVIINAMDPGDRRKVRTEIKYSERDAFWSFIASGGEVLSTKLRLKLFHPGLIFGDGYYVPSIDSWIYPYGIIDYNIAPLATIYRQLGIAVLDDQTGSVALHKLDSVPEEYSQLLILEEFFAEERLGLWAAYHKWTGVLNYHFSQPEIFEPAEDLLYQYDADTNNFYALLQFEPAGSTRKSIVAWAEVAANGQENGQIKLYDARDLGLIGPVKASSIIESEVSQYSKAGFAWVVLQPQFKYIRGRHVYVAPIYAGEGVRITIKGIGIVDAKTEQVKIIFWKDIIGGEGEGTSESGGEIPAGGQPVSGVDTSECNLIYTTESENIYVCSR